MKTLGIEECKLHTQITMKIAQVNKEVEEKNRNSKTQKKYEELYDQIFELCEENGMADALFELDMLNMAIEAEKKYAVYCQGFADSKTIKSKKPISFLSTCLC